MCYKFDFSWATNEDLALNNKQGTVGKEKNSDSCKHDTVKVQNT